jgi:hypothetical protein
MVVGFTGFSKTGQLRVEGITDEFARLVKTQDIMAKLDAVVEGEMDDGFQVRDENVNVADRGAATSGGSSSAVAGAAAKAGDVASNKKRTMSKGKTPTSNKKAKTKK